MTTKIEEVEEKVELLHLNPTQKAHSISRQSPKDLFESFWFFHVKPVIDISKEMARKYGADIEIVWLAAILHDIARLNDVEPHDEISAQSAQKLLLNEGFEERVASEVSSIILTHRCENHIPVTKEQKILASADAITHFKAPFYLWFCHVSSKPFRETLEGNIKKIERDFHQKIFFDEEREQVRKQYEVLKEWLTY